MQSFYTFKDKKNEFLFPKKGRSLNYSLKKRQLSSPDKKGASLN